MSTVLQEIESELKRKLKLKWFQLKVARFQNNKYYNSKKDIIIDPTELGYSSNYDQEEEECCGDTLIANYYEITLNEFVFQSLGSNTLPGTIGEPVEEEDPKWEYKGYNVASQVVDLLLYHLKKGDVSSNYHLIFSSIDKIQKVFEKLKIKYQNEKFSSYLDYMYKWLEEVILNHTADIRLHYVLLDKKPYDLMKFEVNQDQLVALFFLLEKANIISLKDKKTKSLFYEFCEKHFQYKSAETYSHLKNFSTKMSEARTGITIQSMQIVLDKLRMAFRGLV